MEKELQDFNPELMDSDVTETDDQQTPTNLMTDEMCNLTRTKSLEWSDEGDLTDMDYITDSSDYLSSLSDLSEVTENLAAQEEIVWDESFQNLSELSLSRAMSTSLVKPSVVQEKVTRQERLHMYELRHHLNTLNTNLEKAEKLVSEKREELKKCNETIENLQAEEENVFKELQEAEKENKITAYKEELKAWRAKKNEEMKMSQHIREIKQKELQLKLRSAEAQKAKASTAKFLRATIENQQPLSFPLCVCVCLSLFMSLCLSFSPCLSLSLHVCLFHSLCASLSLSFSMCFSLFLCAYSYLLVSLYISLILCAHPSSHIFLSLLLSLSLCPCHCVSVCICKSTKEALQ
ncbi:unnamed protein product [Acanthosepion pharaonis]|uniref:Uncharacterized protein n=1 Tax=Acanthosepion pharaonis TaxID=158019 RepID=A0A812CWG1_ACAPH|nr:unnamed protein product [Sepia pharaonis]